MSFSKTLAKELQKGDYVPNGDGPIDISKLSFRRTCENEGHFRCGCKVGRDPQSGPIFCGKVAEWVADAGKGQYVALCGEGRHVPPPKDA